MGVSSNRAFEGEHTLSGWRVRIEYRNGKEQRTANRARRLPPGHADYRKAGWYWRRVGVGDPFAEGGPFTSSRKAYQAAGYTMGLLTITKTA